MNDLVFGMGGPVMEGTWYNTRTGDSFTVQNSFFEDNQYIVQTTDGRILRYEQIQDYIKSDKPIDMPKKTITNSQLPPEVASLIETNNDILPDDMNMINGYNSLGSLTGYDLQPVEKQQITTPVLKNYDIISKALTKRSLPDFQVGIDWVECPVKEMNMLMDLMEVEYSEIVDWYVSQVDVETTTQMIKEVIKDFVAKQLHPEPVVVEPIDIIEDPTQAPIKKSKKQKTSKKK